MAVLNTESVTNWWPQTSSSKAFVVSRDPGCRTSAHRTANGVGGSATAVPSRSRRAFASSSLCEGSCGAEGVLIVAVLVLRALGEWRQIEQRERSLRS